MTWCRSPRFTAILLPLLLILLIQVPEIRAQQYDLLIRGGHLIDVKNDIDRPMDLAIRNGKVARVARSIPASEASRTVDATGLYIAPGFIDIHAHHFYGTKPNHAYSDGFSSIPPDGFSFRAGVTTAVDVGGAGWRNFPTFKEQVIDRSRTRILSFINIVGAGMRGTVPYEQYNDDMDPKMTALMAGLHPDLIVGVKIAHYRGHEWEPYELSVEAGELAGIPVMVDIGGADPALPLRELFLEIFRPGDIFTHTYGRPFSGHGPKEAPVDENGTLRPHWLEAQERGVIMDVGHGGGSFFYDIAVPATSQGLWPNTISTDIHIGSMNAGMKDQANVMSKFLDLGMSLREVIRASTWKPAKVIQREDLGHLSEGAVADIAVFGIREGDFGFIDAGGSMKSAGRKLEVELTLREGRVVWDLNGMAAPAWDE